MSELADYKDEESSPTIRHTGEEEVRVLVVDDEDSVRGVLTRLLRQRGMIAHGVESGAAAIEAVEKGAFDVILCDVRMPGVTGPQLLARLKADGHPAEFIMMTAFADIRTTVNAVKAGAYGFLTKPFASNDAVALEVLNAAQLKRLRERNARLEKQLSSAPSVSAAPPATSSDRSLLEMLGVLGLNYPDAKKKLLAAFNDAYVRELLRSASGNVSAAARRSGLDRSNFRRLLRSTSVTRHDVD